MLSGERTGKSILGWLRFRLLWPRERPAGLAAIRDRLPVAPPPNVCSSISGARPSVGTGTCTLWVDVIERYVDRFVAPWRKDERLVTTWAAAQKDLSRNWTLAELAALAGVSSEHLRCLCQRSLGRSPMQQLSYLRIQHAAHLLTTTGSKIEEIAGMVGYPNPFAFSNTFKRKTGFRPSTYRVRQGAEGTASRR